jgi:hypothetical protein
LRYRTNNDTLAQYRYPDYFARRNMAGRTEAKHSKEQAMQELWDIIIKVILPLAGILAVSILVRRLLPNPFSGGYGG